MGHGDDNGPGSDDQDMGAEHRGKRPGEHNSSAGRYDPQGNRNGSLGDGEEDAQAVLRCADQWT
eukprot:14041773-Heterocapsa_arctica.AAC.1